MKKLLIFFLVFLFPFASQAETDSEIAKQLIRESISRYSGNCPCPYNVTASGSRCGGRSAYSRPGGAAPLCFEADVSKAQIDARRARNGSSNAQKKAPATPTARTLETGAISGLYDRKDWEHWIDVDGDCQNARAELLLEKSTVPVAYTTESRCNVLRGSWYDVYTGETRTLAIELDVDHLVPLAWANGHGGSSWTKSQKREFANDRQNLILTAREVNRAKGAKGPDEWLPPRKEYRCDYLRRFDSIVVLYKLRYTPAEKRIVDRMLRACGR